MDRRDLIRFLALTGAGSLCGCSSLPIERIARYFDWPENSSANQEDKAGQDIGEVKAEPEKKLTSQEITEELLKDMRAKSIYFSQDFPDDIWFRDEKFETMRRLVMKFRAVQKHVGFGNFNVLGMDEFFHLAQIARGSSEVTAHEKKFLEEIFYFDAKNYGFQGDKVVHSMTDAINRNSIIKIPYTGHFLRKGESLETYNRIIKDIGDSVILTSGVRGVAKQYHLFFEKGLVTQGNMSKASRSLAPPGYSFHGQADFDIGKVGLGLKNFTDDFASTEEYKKLVGLGYIEIRYTQSNLLGVRFEPWHIKVHTEA